MSKTKQLQDIISEEEFREIMKSNTHVICLFYNPLFSICEKAEEILSKLNKQYSETIAFIKINGNRFESICEKYEIDVYPTTVLIYNSKVIKTSFGFSQFELEQFAMYNSDKTKKRLKVSKHISSSSSTSTKSKTLKQRQNVNRTNSPSNQNDENNNEKKKNETEEEYKGCLWILFGDGYSQKLTSDNIKLFLLWIVLFLLIVILVWYVLYITMFSKTQNHYQVKPTWRDHFR